MIVVVCFENPLKEHGISFMSDVLTQKRRVIIPTSSVIGAYHIAIRHLGVPKLAVKKFWMAYCPQDLLRSTHK
ncbi:MAG: hypothetical protein QXU33_03245 [Candidatus Methanomethyliaceae archaeon]